MRTVVSPVGAAGVITPTGLATDKTTAPFFSDTLSNERLYAFYDFDNEAAKWKAVARWSVGFSDWMGVYGSKGDNS